MAQESYWRLLRSGINGEHRINRGRHCDDSGSGRRYDRQAQFFSTTHASQSSAFRALFLGIGIFAVGHSRVILG